MFVNYKHRRYFTDNDRDSMERLAEGAALGVVIVRNAQLSKERQQKLREQEVLLKLSEQLLGELSRQLPVELSKQPLGSAGRERILNRAVAVACDVLESDYCSIILPDSEGRLLVVAQQGLVGVEVGKTEFGRGRESQTGYIIETGRPSRVSDYEKQEPFHTPREGALNDIQSGGGVPMFRESKLIGASLTHSRKHRGFTDEEENILSLIANQTAIALNSSEQISRQNNYLGALLNASTAISKSGLNLSHILDEIVKQAFLCLAGEGEQKAILSTIQRYDEATHTLFFESAHPPSYLQKLRDTEGGKRLIKREAGGKIGIAGRAALEGEAQLVPNVLDDPDYYEFVTSTRSELAIPLIDGDRVRGVLDVESEQFAAFDALHVKKFEALAEIAVIAIRNAEQYEELENAKGI